MIRPKKGDSKTHPIKEGHGNDHIRLAQRQPKEINVTVAITEMSINVAWWEFILLSCRRNGCIQAAVADKSSR
jgi:hypothetical protein